MMSDVCGTRLCTTRKMGKEARESKRMSLLERSSRKLEKGTRKRNRKAENGILETGIQADYDTQVRWFF